MQDGDRLAMLGVGVLVCIYAGIDGYKLWRKRKYLAVPGVGILILGALGVPIALALFAL